MTSNAPMIDVSARGVFVEQLIIGSDNGVPAVLASSMSGPDVQTGWLHVLAPHLRPPVDPDAPRPPALSYLRFSDGSAAVLSRTGADRAVEGVAHVLLGRADLLTPGLALSLSAWSGWHFGQPGQALLQLRPDQLRLGFDVAGALRAQALADADQLARVLGWLLQTSDRPLSIIGCPEPDRVALLWGLTEIAAPICRTRAWTFSTDEGGPSDSWPEIVCLASRPDGPGGGRRTTVDLTRDQWASPEHVKQANRLVFTYQHGWDPAQPPPASAPVVGPPSGPAETPSYAAVGGPAWQPLSLIHI